MPKYEVRRSFAGRENFRRGEVVENPQFRNLAQLIRTGYLAEIVEETSEEKPKKGKKKNGGSND